MNFEIKDYVAPIINIDIKTPSIHLCSDKEFNVTINATYTYGKPVKGHVFATLEIKDKNTVHRKIPTDLFCLNNGFIYLPFKFNFCNEIINMLPLQIGVEAVVSDMATNLKEKATVSRTILSSFLYKISSNLTTKFYKPKLANYIAVSSY